MMQKLIAVLAAGAMLATVGFAGVALAQDAHMCTGSPCKGTNHADNLWEFYRDGRPDLILGRGGNDRLHAETNNRDRDELRGGPGSDILDVSDRDTRDRVEGGPGRDHCIADSRKEIGAGCEGIRIR
jgi:RTX calcium-binding nonapeptide repeat (4 copies)